MSSFPSPAFLMLPSSIAFMLFERAINYNLICSNSSSILELLELRGTLSFSGSFSFSASGWPSPSGLDCSALVGSYPYSSSPSPMSEIDLSKIARNRLRSIKFPMIINKMKNRAGLKLSCWSITYIIISFQFSPVRMMKTVTKAWVVDPKLYLDSLPSLSRSGSL